MIKWKSKRIVVVGLGISNIPLIKFLLRSGAIVYGRDRKSIAELGERYQTLGELGVECLLGEDYLNNLDEFDAVFLTPGIPKHLSEIQNLMGKVPVLSEIALVLAYAKAPVYAITGSSGKTTITTLVGEMLKASGINTFVGGNIGHPLITEVLDIPADACILLELSSFQLELLDQSPHGALVTNISENHLDVHLRLENYIQAKKQIYLHQSKNDFAIFNLDDPVTREMAAEVNGETYFFSMQQPVNQGTYLEDDTIVFCDRNQQREVVLARSEVRLAGDHNVANMLAAVLLARLAGASFDAIRSVGREFAGVAHRLEELGTYQGVDVYNDSKSTTPSSAIAALKAFNQPIVLIAGGYDKHLSFVEFARLANGKVRHMILLGQTAPQIQQTIIGQSLTNTKIHIVGDLPEAVDLAFQLAISGDVLLLSPACASFDMYPNYEERGEHFRRLVLQKAQASEKEM